MAKPKKKQSKSRTRRRGSHFALKPKAVLTCSQCGADVLAHHACPSCGYYKGNSVFVKVYDKAATTAVEAPQAEVAEEATAAKK